MIVKSAIGLSCTKTALSLIIVSKQPLDYNKLNAAISNAQGNNFQEKVLRVIQSERIQGVQYNTSSSTINVACDTKGKNILAVVLEIDKR